MIISLLVELNDNLLLYNRNFTQSILTSYKRPHITLPSFLLERHAAPYRAGGTSGVGRAATQPVFVKFTIVCPTSFLTVAIQYLISAPPVFQSFHQLCHIINTTLHSHCIPISTHKGGIIERSNICLLQSVVLCVGQNNQWTLKDYISCAYGENFLIHIYFLFAHHINQIFLQKTISFS